MLNVRIICVGRLREKFLRDAELEYIKRLSSYCKLEVIEIDEIFIGDRPSGRDIELVLEKEYKNIISRIGGGYKIVSLCIEGDSISSEEFSEYIAGLQIHGCSKLAFVIGGSFGLSTNIKSMSDMNLSMSRMTFPHHMARIILLEQVYRAFNIISNGKYHK